jgi:predicted amidohydrolase YtcJ
VPTGVLRETAVHQVAQVVERHRPPLDAADLLRGLDALRARGITSAGAIVSVRPGPWIAGSEAAALREISGDIPVRIHAFLDGPVEAVASMAKGFSGGRLRFAGVKDFADGSLGGHTAAMVEPYADAPTTGILRLRPDTAHRLAEVAREHHGAVAIHAIGDRAITSVLDVFDDLIDRGWEPNRLRIEHASVITDDQIQRMATLGVVASIQPPFVISDGRWLSTRLGPRRHAYRFRSMHDAGVELVGGSDAPVERPDPPFGLAAARDRGGYLPEESLDEHTAFSLYTSAAARALGEPEPLVPGSPADFVALDLDPVESRPQALATARVLGTWVDGEPGG